MKRRLITLTAILLGQLIIISCQKQDFEMKVKFINKSNDVVNMYLDNYESTAKMSKTNEVVPGSFYIDIYPHTLLAPIASTDYIVVCKNGQIISTKLIDITPVKILYVIWENNTIYTYAKNDFGEACK